MNYCQSCWAHVISSSDFFLCLEILSYRWILFEKKIYMRKNVNHKQTNKTHFGHGKMSFQDGKRVRYEKFKAN